MPTFEIEAPDGRRFQVEGPPGATREQALAMVQQLATASAAQADPFDDVAQIEQMQRRLLAREAGIPLQERRPTSTPIALPLIGQVGSVGGPVGSAIRGMSNIGGETSAPILGAMIGGPLGAGVRFGALPIARTIMGRLAQAPARAALSAAPAMTGAGVVGGAGGALAEAQDPEATAGSIARAALETGGEMALAEGLGMGVGRIASRLAAPNLRFLDPLAGVRRQVREFVSSVPETTRAAARRVEELLPQGAATTAREATEAVQRAARQANDVFRSLTRHDAGRQIPAARPTAEAIARVLGSERAKVFGFNDKQMSARGFVSRVFERGGPGDLARLRKRLGKKRFEDALSLNLASVIERATVRGPGGDRVLDGQRLAQVWRELPEATRNLYTRTTRQAVEGLATFGTTMQRLGRFAMHPVGGEIAEAAVTPVAMVVFGPSVGVPLLVAKSLMNPGLLVRYLTRDQLPSEVVQFLGGQAVRTEFRRGLLDED